MGSCCISSQVPPDAALEEKVLSNSHAILKYHIHSPEAIVSVIMGNSGGNLVTANQLLAIGAALQLNLAGIEMIDSRIFRFYRNFTTKGGNYDARKLSLLGVLLSKGTLKAKLGYYFDCIQPLDNGTAHDFAVKAMFDALVTIAAVHLPQLAIEETPQGESPSFSREQYEDYRDRLLSGKEAIVSRLMTAFLGTVRDVTKERFLQQADRHLEFVRCLSSPVLLRTEMLVEAANIQKSAAIKEALSPSMKSGQRP